MNKAIQEETTQEERKGEERRQHGAGVATDDAHHYKT